VAHNFVRKRETYYNSVLTDLLVKQLVYVWGQGDTNQTPSLEKTAGAIFQAAIAEGLTLRSTCSGTPGSQRSHKRAAHPQEGVPKARGVDDLHHQHPHTRSAVFKTADLAITDQGIGGSFLSANIPG
jgi:hypothetical protein